MYLKKNVNQQYSSKISWVSKLTKLLQKKKNLLELNFPLWELTSFFFFDFCFSPVIYKNREFWQPPCNHFYLFRKYLLATCKKTKFCGRKKISAKILKKGMYGESINGVERFTRKAVLEGKKFLWMNWYIYWWGIVSYIRIWYF